MKIIWKQNSNFCGDVATFRRKYYDLLKEYSIKFKIYEKLKSKIEVIEFEIQQCILVPIDGWIMVRIRTAPF